MTDDMYVPPRKIVGNDTALAAIREALALPAFDGRVLYFVGPGGVGKTRLLEETRSRAKKRKRTIIIEIIDFYHTRLHQQYVLLNIITNSLDQSISRKRGVSMLFEEYRKALELLHSIGGESGEAEQLGRRVLDAFLEEYAQATDQYNYDIVLLLDSFEKLTATELEHYNFRVAERLEEMLIKEIAAQLPRTLVAIAGRPHEKQYTLLREMFGARLHLIELKVFDVDGTKAFARQVFRDTQRKLPSDPHWFQTLHEITHGSPIFLTIALELDKERAIDIQALQPDAFDANTEQAHDQKLPSSAFEPNKQQLSNNQPLQSEQDQTIQDYTGDWYKQLLEFMRKDLSERSPALRELLRIATYLRKGVNRILLRRIAQTTSLNDYDEELVKQFSCLAFVKRTGSLFTAKIGEHEGDEHTDYVIHDDLYDLLFEEPRVPIDELYNPVITYYEEQLEQYRQRSSVPGKQDRLRAPDDVHREQTLLVQQLFYAMARDPVRGYQRYRYLADDAVLTYSTAFDAQLRTELAQFYNQKTTWGRWYRSQLEGSGLTWDRILFDEAVRWMYRRIETQLGSENRYAEALQLAGRIRQDHQAFCEADELARCTLDIAQLQARIFAATSTWSEVMRDYDYLTNRLDALRTQLQEHASDNAFADIQYQHATMQLAMAYNNWGYYERTWQRYQSAIEKYRTALRLYHALAA